MTDTWGYKAAIRRDLFSLFPAHAGVIPLWTAKDAGTQTFPRACGGDPYNLNQIYAMNNFSPRMRG